MKIIVLILSLVNLAFASVPTEEGLLRNLNNANIPGVMVTLKAEVKKMGDDVGPQINRVDYYKWVFIIGDSISLFQINYNGSQMQNNQIQDVKLIGDLADAIEKNSSPDIGMFYGALTMLATNRSDIMESFIGRTGSLVVKNKAVLNEDKMKLIRTYRNYLLSTKGKGEATSPLNPQDPAEKAKVVEIFKSNTFVRSKNVELVKEGNEFLWKADWKTVRAAFTNEERRLKYIEFSDVAAKARLDVSDYTLFNNVNEFPKNMLIKDSNGEAYKITFFGQEVKKTQDKKLSDRQDEAKKSMNKAIDQKEIFKFLL